MNRRTFIKTAIAGGAALWLPKPAFAINPIFLTRGLEPETAAWSRIATPTAAEQKTVNENIRAIKYGSGVTFASVTGNIATVATGALAIFNSFDIRPYRNFLLSVAAGGKTTAGYIGAAGGEAAVTDVFAGWDLTSGFTTISASIDDLNSFTSTGGGSGGVAKTPIFTVGGLYKSVYVASTSASSTSVRDGGSVVAMALSDGVPKYTTAPAIAVYIRNASAGTTNIATLESYRVTDVASTGARIFTTSALTTQSWASNDGIDPNAATFTLTITRQ